jgi:hypothetical protein
MSEGGRRNASRSSPGGKNLTTWENMKMKQNKS